MALRIWLPLNGNYDNKGISGATTTSSSGNFNSAGVVTSKSWYTGIIRIPFTYTGTNQLSVALWLKPNTPDAWTSIFGWGHSNVSNRIEVNANGGTGYIYFGSNGLVARSTQLTNSVINLAWNHIALVADGTKVRFYVNGVKTADVAQTHTVAESFAGNPEMVIGGYGDQFKGWYNDFRVYDHAISAKEVKELSRGLCVHLPFFGDGYPGIGRNLATGVWGMNPVETNILYETTLAYDDYNFFGLKEGDSYKYRVKITSPSDRGVYAGILFWLNGETSTMLAGNTTIPAGETGYSTVTATLTSDYLIYSRMELRIYDTDRPYGAGAATAYISEVKLERGDHATKWSEPVSSSSHGPDYNPWVETTGFCTTVSASGHEPTLVSSGPRYGMSARFYGGVAGETQEYIEYSVPAGMNKATWMCWVCPSDQQGSYPSLDCKKGDPAGNLWLAINTESNAVWAYYGGVYNKARTTMFSPGDWHHIAFTWNAGVTQWYIDGEPVGSSVDMSSKSTTWPNTTRSIGNSYAGSTWSGAKLKSSISDWRMYATVLSADDIREIAKAPVSFTNNGEVHACAVIESDNTINPEVKKNGLVEATSFSEVYGRYDNSVRFEPDGSAWMRIVHHSEPGTNNLFASTDSFGTWVYKDAKRWFHGKMCDYADRWEFLVEQKTTATATVQKYRWVQTKNPNTAAWSEVASANVTKNSSSGYTVSSYGGIYKKNSNTYYSVNNGTSGNWFGALGSWTVWSEGIPGWDDNAVKTGGYIDLYIRLDGGANWSWPANDRVSIIKTDKSITEYGIVEI